MLSCRSVGKLCGVEAYLMAMLLPCTSYYDLNHGTVRNSSRRSFATTWNRISSCSVHLGNLCNDVISYRATAGYEEVTDVYDGMSTLHTSRHNVYRVEARRDMVDMMHGEELGETMPDMFTNESISTYDVISSHGLHTCMEHALQYNYDCTCNYRNGH